MTDENYSLVTGLVDNNFTRYLYDPDRNEVSDRHKTNCFCHVLLLVYLWRIINEIRRVS